MENVYVIKFTQEKQTLDYSSTSNIFYVNFLL